MAHSRGYRPTQARHQKTVSWLSRNFDSQRLAIHRAVKNHFLALATGTPL